MAYIGTRAMLTLIAMFGLKRAGAIMTPTRPHVMLASLNQRLNESFASTADLNEYTYEHVLASKDEDAMKAFILRLMVKWNMAVKDEDRSKFDEFAAEAAQSGQYESLPDLKKALEMKEWIVKQFHAVAAKVSESVHAVADKLHNIIGKSEDAVADRAVYHRTSKSQHSTNASATSPSAIKTAHAANSTAETASAKSNVTSKSAETGAEHKVESATEAEAGVHAEVASEKHKEHHKNSKAHHKKVTHEVSPSKHAEKRNATASIGEQSDTTAEAGVHAEVASKKHKEHHKNSKAHHKKVTHEVSPSKHAEKHNATASIGEQSDTTAEAGVHAEVASKKHKEHHMTIKAHHKKVTHEVSPSKHVEKHVDPVSIEDKSDTKAEAGVHAEAASKNHKEHHKTSKAHHKKVTHRVSPSKHGEKHDATESMGTIDHMISDMENMENMDENTLDKQKKPADAKEQTPAVKHEKRKSPAVAVKDIDAMITDMEQAYKSQKAVAKAAAANASTASAATASNASAADASTSMVSTGEQSNSTETESQRSAARQLSCAFGLLAALSLISAA